VSPDKAYLSSDASQMVLDILSDKLQYRVYGWQFMPACKSGRWDGYKKLFYKRSRQFPTGCLFRVERILKKLNILCEIEYINATDPIGKFVISGIDPYNFQLDCAEIAVKNKYGIIHAPVRAGKTAIIGLILSRVKQCPMWVVTYGKDLVIQTKQQMERFLPDMKVGLFSESEFENGDIIVSSYQALSRVFSENSTSKEGTGGRNQEIQSSICNAKVLILDECHYALAPKSSKVVAHFKNADFRIGLSGTPKPQNKGLIELEAAIGPVLIKIPMKKLIDLKRIAQPIALIYDLPNEWYSYYLGDFSEWYEVNIVRNISRNKFISSIVQKLHNKNKTCFVMVRKRYHGELLQELVPKSVYVHGDISSDIRKELYSRIHNKEIMCIISTVGKVGLDIPNLNAVINAEGLKAETITVQKMRSLTASSEKDCGLVIDFMDKGVYLRDHSNDRLKMYEKIDGFIIKKVDVPTDYFSKQTLT
jgi:superfamily II DNA or RNA helicase